MLGILRIKMFMPQVDVIICDFPNCSSIVLFFEKIVQVIQIFHYNFQFPCCFSKAYQLSKWLWLSTEKVNFCDKNFIEHALKSHLKEVQNTMVLIIIGHLKWFFICFHIFLVQFQSCKQSGIKLPRRFFQWSPEASNHINVENFFFLMSMLPTLRLYFDSKKKDLCIFQNHLQNTCEILHISKELIILSLHPKVSFRGVLKVPMKVTLR